MKPFRATYNYKDKVEEEVVLVISFLKGADDYPADDDPIAIFIHNDGKLDWDSLHYFTKCQIPWN